MKKKLCEFHVIELKKNKVGIRYTAFNNKIKLEVNTWVLFVESLEKVTKIIKKNIMEAVKK